MNVTATGYYQLTKRLLTFWEEPTKTSVITLCAKAPLDYLTMTYQFIRDMHNLSELAIVRQLQYGLELQRLTKENIQEYWAAIAEMERMILDVKISFFPKQEADLFHPTLGSITTDHLKKDLPAKLAVLFRNDLASLEAFLQKITEKNRNLDAFTRLQQRCHVDKDFYRSPEACELIGGVAYANLACKDLYDHELCTIVQQAIQLLQKETEQPHTPPKGFVFSVTNQAGIRSFLVGTIHEATNEMMYNPITCKVIEASKELILECNSPCVKNTKSVDAALFTYAERNKLSVAGLETATSVQPHIDKIKAFCDKKDSFTLTLEQLQEIWVSGNMEQLIVDVDAREEIEVICAERNRIWLYKSPLGADTGLIEKLQKTQHSICIGVGFLHVPELREAFMEAGFEVHRILGLKTEG